jgi:hypothetical protein
VFKYQEQRKKKHNKLGVKGKIENVNGGDYTTNASKQKHPWVVPLGTTSRNN